MERLLEGFFCVNNGFSLQNLEIASLLVMLLEYHQQMLYLLILEKKVTIHTKKPSNMLMTGIYYGNEMRKCQIMDVLSLSLSYKVIILSIDKLQTFLVLLL